MLAPHKPQPPSPGLSWIGDITVHRLQALVRVYRARSRNPGTTSDPKVTVLYLVSMEPHHCPNISTVDLEYTHSSGDPSRETTLWERVRIRSQLVCNNTSFAERKPGEWIAPGPRVPGACCWTLRCHPSAKVSPPLLSPRSRGYWIATGCGLRYNVMSSLLGCSRKSLGRLAGEEPLEAIRQ